ncbi:hypothetical protein J2P12_01105 [Candidatus Bathyarchaeota archaeon]|nr:hypothetical protein [Candidatus Bathyarchaeota archaeon]
MNTRDREFVLSKGVESLTKEEHGLFFDAAQRLALPSEVKQAAVTLYLDFKNRPAGVYNESRKNLDIFLIASVSLAAKALGDIRTDQEFEAKMFVSREKLVDAEERILMSFRVQDTVIPYSELVLQLTKRQIRIMSEGFAERGLIDISDVEELKSRSEDYLDEAVKRGLNPKMSYRGRAAAVILKSVKDMQLRVSEVDIANSAGFSKGLMLANADVIDSLLRDSNVSGRKDS